MEANLKFLVKFKNLSKASIIINFVSNLIFFFYELSSTFEILKIYYKFESLNIFLFLFINNIY